MTRITKEPAERKREIIDAAIKLFYEKGYEKTSIADIAKSIGVAQGLCYRYFSSKEEIFDTAIDEYAEILSSNMIKSIKIDTPIKEVINTMPTYKDIEKNDNFYYKVFHGKESKKIHYQLSIKVCEKMVPFVETLIENAIKRKEIEKCDVQAIASFSLYGQIGILLDDELSTEEKIKKIKEALKKFF